MKTNDWMILLYAVLGGANILLAFALLVLGNYSGSLFNFAIGFFLFWYMKRTLL